MVDRSKIDNEWEKKRSQLIVQAAGRLEKIQAKAVNRMAGYFNQIKPTEAAKKVWTKNPAIEKKIDNILADFNKELADEMEKSFKNGWHLANDKQDDIMADYMKGMAIGKELKRGMFDRNLKAMQTFLDEGMGEQISDRVWNISKQYKEQLSFFAASGIGTGRDSRKIARDLKKYLKNPDKRFRRVRDPETGKLKLSKPAKDYHPGAGVYRSSYKNALRFTATNTNRAYRIADYNRMQNEPFVTGIEIKLSAAHPEPDICDAQVGKYPKGYKFDGFHPFCICYQVAVTLGKRDFAKYLKSGQVPNEKYINSIPTAAQNYLNKHASKLKSGSKPYFVQNNFKNIKDGFAPKKGVYPVDTKSINDVAKEGANPEIRDLTKDENYAIDQYRLNLYESFNRSLRAGEPINPNFKNEYHSLKSAIRHSPKHEGTVYRGALLDTSEEYNNIMNKAKNGYLNDPAFLSTSKDEGIAHAFMKTRKEINKFRVKFKIKANGKNGIDVNKIIGSDSAEEEVLFDASTSFRVKDIKDFEKYTEIEMEEL